VSSSAKPQTIRLLPEHLIDQIKAGEVIERSANVLKELIENALDAGAKQVDVEIRDNGLTLMRVSDDGHGISREQIPLAFGRHATSKINAFEDLYRLSTFGFRGEALPSIASVSRMECVSWTQDEPQGGTLRFEGGKQEALHGAEKSGRVHGTVMTIQDLFFNTPVRLKFLQSPTSEKNWLKRFFYSFVLASPQVGFSILWDDDERQFYAPTTDHVARLRQLF
jgi:DNA mismatch repair protein MutL